MKQILNCTPHTLELPDIVSAKGIYLWDSRGNQYMDLESGVWCTALGHGHPKVNQVLLDQAGKALHSGFCYASPILEQAAKAVLSISGFEQGQAVFLCSGSEAIELARQIAKHLSGRHISMTLHDSYLGSYSSVTNRKRDWFLFNWEECRNCPKGENCDPGCQKLAQIPEDICEFIFEPGSSSGFVRFPPKGLIRQIAGQVRSNGGIIIANEVTCGIGRTGKWFGHEHYGITPDMIAMGKGIGNGYPVSVTAMDKKIASKLNASDFKYMQSHQNDPMGAAIARQVIQTIKDEGLIEKAADLGHQCFEMLTPLLAYPQVTGIRGRGLMFAVDICDEPTGDTLFRNLIDQGFILGNRKAMFRIDPPLIMDELDFQRFVAVFDRVLADCEA